MNRANGVGAFIALVLIPLDGNAIDVQREVVVAASTSQPTGPDLRPHPADPPTNRVSAARCGGNYLLAWDSAHAIFAARVTDHGDVLDDPPILITDDGVSPAVAASGASCLIVWVAPASPTYIKALRLNTYAQAIDVEPVELARGDPDYFAGYFPQWVYAPQAASDGATYLVSYARTAYSPDVVGTVYSESFEPLDDRMLIQGSWLPTGWSWAFVPTASGYALVAPDTMPQSFHLFEDAHAAPGFFRFPGHIASPVAAAWDGADYLAVWHTYFSWGFPESLPDGVRAAHVDAAASRYYFPEDVTFLDGETCVPAAAFDGTDYLVAWFTPSGSFGATLSREGEVLTPRTPLFGAETVESPVLASTSKGVSLLAYVAGSSVRARVLVTDTAPPVLSVPVVIRATTPGDGTVVTYAVAATDDRSGPVDAACLPTSGTRFPVGTTRVDCMAADLAGNVGVASFDVIVAREEYTIDASVAGGSGTISPAGVFGVPAGESRAFSIVPDEGYRINYVAVNGASVGAVTSYTLSNVRRNCTITADFVPITYKVIVTQSPNGAIAPSTYAGFLAGATQAYELRPSTGYHVASLTVDGVPQPVAASYTFADIRADHAIAATFAPNPSYTIQASAGPNGSIAPAGATALLGGQVQSYAIAPASGYRVDRVVVDGVNRGALASYAFQGVAADHTIEAAFVRDEYTVSASVLSGSGTITPAGATTVPGGGSVAYAIAPAAGFRIAYVAVNGASVGSPTSYTLANVRANAALSVSFVPVTYRIVVSAGPNGAIAPSTYAGFAAGATQAYALRPSTGYHVASLTVDGVPQPVAASYTFADIRADHAIAATFAANP